MFWKTTFKTGVLYGEIIRDHCETEPHHVDWPNKLSNDKYQLDQFIAVCEQCINPFLYPVTLAAPNNILRWKFSFVLHMKIKTQKVRNPCPSLHS